MRRLAVIAPCQILPTQRRDGLNLEAAEAEQRCERTGRRRAPFGDSNNSLDSSWIGRWSGKAGRPSPSGERDTGIVPSARGFRGSAARKASTLRRPSVSVTSILRSRVNARTLVCTVASVRTLPALSISLAHVAGASHKSRSVRASGSVAADLASDRSWEISAAIVERAAPEEPRQSANRASTSTALGGRRGGLSSTRLS
jgi:hypothetical protein